MRRANPNDELIHTDDIVYSKTNHALNRFINQYNHEFYNLNDVIVETITNAINNPDGTATILGVPTSHTDTELTIQRFKMRQKQAQNTNEPFKIHGMYFNDYRINTLHRLFQQGYPLNDLQFDTFVNQIIHCLSGVTDIKMIKFDNLTYRDNIIAVAINTLTEKQLNNMLNHPQIANGIDPLHTKYDPIHRTFVPQDPTVTKRIVNSVNIIKNNH